MGVFWLQAAAPSTAVFKLNISMTFQSVCRLRNADVDRGGPSTDLLGDGADMDCLSEQELRVWRNRIESWKCDTFMVPTQQSLILWNEKFFPLKKSWGPPTG